MAFLKKTPIQITSDLIIPFDELNFTFSRSGGKGGQHVNKVASKVQLSFDIKQSQSIPSQLKDTLLKNLEHRLTEEGLLKLSSERTRHQSKNRSIVIERFKIILKQGLKTQKPRLKTHPTKASIEKRLQRKKHTAMRKSLRQQPEL